MTPLGLSEGQIEDAYKKREDDSAAEKGFSFNKRERSCKTRKKSKQKKGRGETRRMSREYKKNRKGEGPPA